MRRVNDTLHVLYEFIAPVCVAGVVGVPDRDELDPGGGAFEIYIRILEVG